MAQFLCKHHIVVEGGTHSPSSNEARADDGDGGYIAVDSADAVGCDRVTETEQNQQTRKPLAVAMLARALQGIGSAQAATEGCSPQLAKRVH